MPLFAPIFNRWHPCSRFKRKLKVLWKLRRYCVVMRHCGTDRPYRRRRPSFLREDFTKIIKLFLPWNVNPHIKFLIVWVVFWIQGLLFLFSKYIWQKYTNKDTYILFISCIFFVISYHICDANWKSGVSFWWFHGTDIAEFNCVRLRSVKI